MSKMASKGSKDKNLESVLADIEKQFGKGAVMRLGDNPHMKLDVVSSGCLSLDVALGIGGYPKGRIIEIYGPESSGKTTFALQAIAEVQKKEEEQLLLMQNMHLILFMLKDLVLILMNLFCHNLILVNKHLKFVRL